MSMDLTGINNYNEYYTNHYFASIFEENAADTISAWRSRAKEEEVRAPWSLLRENSRQFYTVHDKVLRSRADGQILSMIRDMADLYLASLGYPPAAPFSEEVPDGNHAPIYLEIKKPNGAPLLWVLLATSTEDGVGIMQGECFHAEELFDNGEDDVAITTMTNEELATKILFAMDEPPRWLIFVGLNQIALVDRNKWNEKRYLEFDLDEIFSRREESTLQAMAVLLHKESLCPEDGKPLLDTLDENSHRHSAGVSQDLKFALRESIELLGNEVLYDLVHRRGRNLDTEPVDAAKLSMECLRYMYRMLFMLFIEARPELGYAPMKAQAYVQGYSLESLRDIADNIREEINEVGQGYFLHETLAKLFDLIYNGYPENEVILKNLSGRDSLHDVFIIDPLKAHIFDPEYTPMITAAKLRNCVLLRIIELMSITRPTGRRNDRRGRISYSTLGINQMGAVYEALLSYRGFIAVETLFEVKRERDEFNELDVGYFVPEDELDKYTEAERVRYPDGKLRKYDKGTFIYRLAGREREKSASYYTPEVLTKCLVKYALKELLEGKSADEILHLTVCEPAMGSAAFLNEAINQLAEAYLDKKQKELDETISYEDRYQELQRVKMYIADRNVYGIDLNPIAVELAEVSLWLNTIYKGGFVPWFGNQLVCGNSLIGARKQCYRIEQLQANRAPAVWYENAPERIEPGSRRQPRKQIYHFLTGDPGMANYTDKLIKELAPEEIKKIKEWNKKITAPHQEDEIQTLLRLSTVIDQLWAKQVELRKTVREQTADAMIVYGQQEEIEASPTTIREKDLIYKQLYKSEDMKNAGPYARLKFAMDYWCALWFWPIDKADLLPSRSEFLFDMSMILEGTIDSVHISKGVRLSGNSMQLSLFPTEMEEKASEILALYDDKNVVDLPALCERNPRLKFTKDIAAQNHFMHWELEFADLFETRGGFDLVIGNPPWIKMEWKEQSILSDKHPMFAVNNLTATQTSNMRLQVLKEDSTKALYFSEFELISGTQGFLNAFGNYPMLIGQQTNLFRCFLPQAWQFSNKTGVSAFIHPDGVYDDPNGGTLREQLYPRLRKHFQFINELKLFAEVHHNTMFSLNVYCNVLSARFDTIANLFDVSTIEQCYDNSNSINVPGIKDEENNWNIKGHSERVVQVGKKELTLFAKLFDGGTNWNQARLPALHLKQLFDVLMCINKAQHTIGMMENVVVSKLKDETNAQKDGTIRRFVHFPDGLTDSVLSGPHIGIANPLFKSSRKICKLNSDYDSIDLTKISSEYIQRCNYTPNCSVEEYMRGIPDLPWGGKFSDCYRVVAREMLSISGERTLISAILPPKSSYISTLYGFAADNKKIVQIAGSFASIIADFYIKVVGRGHCQFDIFSTIPIFNNCYTQAIVLRALLLNCLTCHYAQLYESEFNISFITDSWSKSDLRLNPHLFTSLTAKWTWETPLRTDYERRQALVEIDVLTALALGMTFEQLKMIYRIQFPVLQSYEADTWYDQNGRIVFTNNRSLTGVGYNRGEWEPIKGASSGIFTRTITDDTMPGGPIERKIEYVAPFDRCDREQDYETAWKFFEEKYGRKS